MVPFFIQIKSMKIKSLALAGGLAFFGLSAFAQDLQNTPAPVPTLPCSTGDAEMQELYKRPDIKQNMQELEQFTQEFIKNNQHKKMGAQKIIIPVVFHIIHNGGSENVSKAQVLDALKVINTDYAIKC